MATVLAGTRMEGSLSRSLPLRVGQPVAGGSATVAVLWREESQAGASDGGCSRDKELGLGKGLSLSQRVPLTWYGPGTGHVVGAEVFEQTE